MATYYAINAGGNWSAGATWSTVSAKDASRVGGSTAPTSADDCIIDDYSGNVTISAASAAKTANFTGFTGTLTFNSAYILTVAGNVTLSATMTVVPGASPGAIAVSAAATVVSNGVTAGIGLTISGSGPYYLNTNGTTWAVVTINGTSRTINLQSNLQCVDLCIAAPYGGQTFAGAYDIACTNLYIAAYATVTLTHTFPAGQTLTVSTLMQLNLRGVLSNGMSIVSGTPSSAWNLHFNGAAADCKVFGGTFTDVTCAHPIDNWYGGTLTRCSGITNRTSADFATTAQAGDIQSGTTISGVAGTLTLPTEAQVQSGIQFGGGGTEFTGTLVGGGSNVFCVMD